MYGVTFEPVELSTGWLLCKLTYLLAKLSTEWLFATLTSLCDNFNVTELCDLSPLVDDF